MVNKLFRRSQKRSQNNAKFANIFEKFEKVSKIGSKNSEKNRQKQGLKITYKMNFSKMLADLADLKRAYNPLTSTNTLFTRNIFAKNSLNTYFPRELFNIYILST